MPSPSVAVIVPARDAAATLPALLDALAAQRGAPAFEVVLADDGSVDATRALATAHPLGVRIVDASGRGPGAARNAAVAATDAALLAFTDADCAPEAGWLAALVAGLQGADLVQGAVVPAGPCGPWDRTVRVGQLTHLYETANLGCTRALFDALGGFAPWLSPRRSKELAEDVWLGWRARRAGARIAFCADAVVAHAVFPRGPGGYVAERLRLRFFPVMAARIPELRTTFLHRRVFLSRRSAAFDAAVAGAGLAIVARRPWPLLLTLPYLRLLRVLALRTGRRRAPAVAAVEVAADAVGLAALAAGSAARRSVVL